MTGLIALVAVGLAACASDNPRAIGGNRTSFGSEPPPEIWQKSQAPGAAYAAEAFTYRKHQPVGEANEYLFYYKHCTQDGHGTYYSKTSYECTGP